MTAIPKQEHHAPTLNAPTLGAETEMLVGERSREQEDVRELVAEPDEDAAAKRSRRPASGSSKPKDGGQPNNVRKLRQAAMMSKAELARRAGVSPLTIDRVESGCPCRMDTKRKILEALGLSPSAREQVFGPDIDQG